MRYRYLDNFRRGISVLGTPECPPLERKVTVFTLLYNPPPGGGRGGYIWRGDLMEGFLRYEFGGPIFGWAYTWRGLFSEFYGIVTTISRIYA